MGRLDGWIPQRFEAGEVLAVHSSCAREWSRSLSPQLAATRPLAAPASGHPFQSIAPDAQGRLPEVCYSRLKEIGQWLKQYGNTLKGLARGPWPEKCNMPLGIADQNKWYVYMPFDQDEVLTLDDPRDPAKVTRQDTMQEVAWTRDESGKIQIRIDPTQRTLLVDVLQIDWEF